jgi:uncharacterized protein (DUF433 family)
MIQLDRITQDAGVMGGKACIRGMRVTVGMIVGQIGAGHTVEEILADYPYLKREDVRKRFGMRRDLPKTAKLSFLALTGSEALTKLTTLAKHGRYKESILEDARRKLETRL